jgi:tetratricopeptide (TPR) repeat protein
LAACLLLAVTVLLSRPQSWPGGVASAEHRVYQEARGLLAARQFSQARQTVADAARGGTASDRLRSLDAQAARGMTSVVALTDAGRLTDFGVDVTGAVGRAADNDRLSQGLAAAQQSLADIGHTSVEALLNRGHVALSGNRHELALNDFEAAVRLAPSDPLAHLGRGLAHYMNDDLPAAESDFREATRLAPTLAAPRMNLAIALTEQGKNAEALAAWRELLDLSPPPSDRAQAERAIKLLSKP